MDKASIIQDAIAYIQELQEQERRILAEVSDLGSGSCTAAVKAENVVEEDGPPQKKTRRTTSASSINDAFCSPPTRPVEILEVIIYHLLELYNLLVPEC